MSEIKVLKDEVLDSILKNRDLRRKIGDFLNVDDPAVKALARRCKSQKIRGKLCDVGIVVVLKKELNYKSIDDLFEVVKL